MKKFISIISTVLVLCCAVCLFTACKEDAAVIDKSSFVIEEKTYAVGDAFSTSDVVITAKLKNGEVRKIDSHLKFVQDELTDEVLDKDKKFIKEGTYNVKVYYVEERDDMEIGTWKITVTKTK